MRWPWQKREYNVCLWRPRPDLLSVPDEQKLVKVMARSRSAARMEAILTTPGIWSILWVS